MKNELIKIGEYAESLEQRVAALEARLQTLEQLQSASATTIVTLTQQISVLTQRVIELEARPVSAVTSVSEEEPEVEVELIVEPDSEEEVINEPIIGSEPVVETTKSEPAPIVEEVKTEPIIEPAIEEKAESEPVVEEQQMPVVEEVKSEPVRPVQTSLFGTSVQDIRQAISLGDRFLFQRELFGGNGEKMQKTLDQLNACADYAEAESYVDSNFSWDKENTTTKLFFNVLHRRFG